MTQRTLIIAEVGVNHNGDLDLAKRIVDAIAVSDVDIIKFQTFTPELLMTSATPKAEYQKNTTGEEESAIDMIASLAFTQDQYRELQTYVEATGKRFLDRVRPSQFAIFERPRSHVVQNSLR